MSSKKQKLELTWVGKEIRYEFEQRILLESSFTIRRPIS
jgi:hypothetical protein